VAAIAIPIALHPAPRLVWNASASAPLGFYRTVSGPVARGDLVLAELPPAARALAAKRGYLPLGVPLVKRVGALAGDVVCRRHRTVTINRQPVAEALPSDSKGRALPSWKGCHKLGQDEVFLLVPAVADSFDGRYFGPIKRSHVIGKLVPLWTW
jgi:conjugative transfer signal peptidase TraF